MASPFLLVPYFGLWSAACALAVVLPSAIGDWHLVLDTAHTLLFVYLERFSDYCSEHERQLLHASYHAIFASALYYVIGAKAMTKTLAGRAYLPGAWIVVASGVFVGALDGGLDTFMMFHADAYTTPWHWCLYTFAVEYGRADWAYPVLIYNFYRNTYLLLFFLPGFLVNKVNTDLGTAAAAQSTLASILCVLLPLSTYCIAWCVLFPRILKFAEHSRALYARVTKSKTA